MTSSSNLSETHHNAAWGAAWTALVAIGEAPSFAAIKESLPKEKKVTANMKAHAEYMDIYKKYVKLNEAVSPFFE